MEKNLQSGRKAVATRAVDDNVGLFFGIFAPCDGLLLLWVGKLCQGCGQNCREIVGDFFKLALGHSCRFVQNCGEFPGNVLKSLSLVWDCTGAH